MASRGVLFAFIFILIFTFALFGCGGSDGDSSSSSDSSDDDDDASDDDSSDDDDDSSDDDDSTDDDDDSTDDDDDDDDTPVYMPPDGIEVVFYDIGQGDAALVRFPLGSTMLIDGGPNEAGEDVILPHFDQIHLDYIDVMVATHPHADHIGGLDEVVYGAAVGEVWENGDTHTTQSWSDFENAVDGADIERKVVTAGWEATLDGCNILILSADEGFNDLNSDSITLTIDCEETVFLFTGDATEETMDWQISTYGFSLAADVVKVAHHGSADRESSFPDYVLPDYAVISCGADNPYGHPNADVVSEWEDAGADVYRTDQDGQINILAKEGQTAVETE